MDRENESIKNAKKNKYYDFCISVGKQLFATAPELINTYERRRETENERKKSRK